MDKSFKYSFHKGDMKYGLVIRRGQVVEQESF